MLGKNKLYLVIGLALVLGAVLFFRLRVGDSVSPGGALTSNQEVNHGAFKFDLAQDPTVFVSVFSTDDSRVHLELSPTVNLQLPFEVTQTPQAVTISGLEFTPTPKTGRLVRLYPVNTPRNLTCLGHFFEPCRSPLAVDQVKDMGDSHSYPVKSEPKTLGELPPNLGPVRFALYLLDVGRYDHDQVMKTEGRFSSQRVLEYAQVDPASITGKLKFNVTVKSADGRSATQRFQAELDGAKLLSSGRAELPVSRL